MGKTKDRAKTDDTIPSPEAPPDVVTTVSGIARKDDTIPSPEAPPDVVTTVSDVAPKADPIPEREGLPGTPEGRTLIRLALGIGLDVLLPLATYVMASWWTLQRLFIGRDHLLASSAPNILAPNDTNGSMWYYWWFHQTLSEGGSWLYSTLTRFPFGETLGKSFPNHIDAWIAYPFYASLEFPASYNLFLMVVPILGAFAGYLCLRAFTHHRFLALAGGLLYGFNGFTFYELDAGRPVTGLIFTLPLVVGAWRKALWADTRRWAVIWTVLTGLAGALTFQHYVPNALWLGVILLAMAGWHGITAHRGLRRLQPGLTLIVAGLIGVFLSLPYLHELLFIREMAPAVTLVQGEPRREALSLLSPSLYRDFLQMGDHPGSDPGHIRGLSPSREQLERVQRYALSADYLWTDRTDNLRRSHTWVPPILWGLLLMVWVMARGCGSGWLLAAASFHLLSLGPYASLAYEHEATQILVGGTHIKLPFYWLMRQAPGLVLLIHPYRFFPFVWLCLLLALILAANHCCDDVRRWLEPRRYLAWTLSVGLSVGIALMCGGVLREVKAHHGLEVMTQAWDPPPFLKTLAAKKHGLAVVELPLGLGHGTGLYQIVHQRPRAEALHDVIPELKLGHLPDPNRLRLEALQALWSLGLRGNPDRMAAADHLTRKTLTALREAGFGYLILYVEGYMAAMQSGILYDGALIDRTLARALGSPLYQDDRILVYGLPEGEPRRASELVISPEGVGLDTAP